jgi:hypothetical protein
VRIDARAARANISAALYIQQRRPNDRAYRAPNWNKHSLGRWVELMGVGDPECALMHALRAQTCAQPCTSSICGLTAGPIGSQHTLVGTMGSTYGGRRSRVRIDARDARPNMRAVLHIQHMRPNGWADRAQHTLIGTMGSSYVGRECALMRAQTCTQHQTYRIGARRAGPIEPQIGIKTH